jgi:pyridoxine kinase
LDYLCGETSSTLAAARDAIQALHDRGPRAVLVTSLRTDETPEDCIDMIASDESGRFRLRTPRLGIEVNGAGDAISALFFAHYLRSGDIAEALARSGSAIFGILQKTAEVGTREMQLIAAQDEIVAPSRLFEPERLT